MKSRVRFPVLPWGFFLEGEDPHGDHGLGSLVEFRFKAPPGTSYSYITIHLIGTTKLRLMGGCTSATTGTGDHDVHKGHMVALETKFVIKPDDVRNCRPKHVAYMRNKLMSEHSCCCIGLITIEDIDLINTMG
jgi:hypothetical protein